MFPVRRNTSNQVVHFFLITRTETQWMIFPSSLLSICLFLGSFRKLHGVCEHRWPSCSAGSSAGKSWVGRLQKGCVFFVCWRVFRFETNPRGRICVPQIWENQDCSLRGGRMPSDPNARSERWADQSPRFQGPKRKALLGASKRFFLQALDDHDMRLLRVRETEGICFGGSQNRYLWWDRLAPSFKAEPTLATCGDLGGPNEMGKVFIWVCMPRFPFLKPLPLLGDDKPDQPPWLLDCSCFGI